MVSSIVTLVYQRVTTKFGALKPQICKWMHHLTIFNHCGCKIHLTREAFRFSRLRIHVNPFESMGSPWNIFPWHPAVVSDCHKKGGISGTKHRAWRVSSFGSPSRIPDIGRCHVVLDWAGLLGKIIYRKPMGLATPVKGFAAFLLKYGVCLSRVPRVCGLVYPVITCYNMLLL